MKSTHEDNRIEYNDLNKTEMIKMYEDFTPEYIKNKIMADTSTVINKAEGSFAHDLASGVAYNIYELYRELNALLGMMFFDSLVGEYLDKRCEEYGLTRTAGKIAQGSVTIASRYSVTIPGGTLFSCNGNNYVSTEAVTSSDSSCTVKIEAEYAGSKYNADSSQVIRLVLPIAGVTSVTLAGDITGGVDAETDESLRNRLYDHIKAAGSGCVNDYIKWAKEVSGVGSVQVVPCFDGPGTVKVIISDSEFTGASESLITAVSEHIEKLRPIGSVVTVCAAQTVSISIFARVSITANTTLADLKASFEKRAAEYIKTVAKDGDSVKLSKICSLIMELIGVTDCADIALNGEALNVIIPSGSIPVISEVTLVEEGV